MKKLSLTCTSCNQSYPLATTFPRCQSCNEPLEVETVTSGQITAGNSLKQNIIDRYQDFYPFDEIDHTLSLQEGFTPLIAAQTLAQEIGVANLLLKNETANPTWSFKDRGTYLGIQHAVALGYNRIGTVSTGNMAASVAAYGARAGLETFVFVSSTIAEEKLNPIAIYGPNLIKVEGDYGNLYFESLKIGIDNDIYFINSDVPLRVEGSKSIAFEICEQLDFNLPDYVVVPTSAGGNLRGILKGFIEFKRSGLTTSIPKIICAQSTGCAPIANAYTQNQLEISRVQNPNTIAHGIENPFPPSGNEVLRKLRQYDGIAVVVDNNEIIKAQRQLAQQGIFGQPASAVPIAAVKKLRTQGMIAESASVACIITGSGLKYTAAFKEHDLNATSCPLESLSHFIQENY